MTQKRGFAASGLRAIGLATVSMLALSGVAAHAQDAGTAKDGEQAEPPTNIPRGNQIIVTARTFEEDLQDVPIAVSALTGDALTQRAADDLGDIADNIVGFAFEEFTGLLAQPTIRGQTNLRVTSPVSNVATYLDGIYIQRNYLIDQGLLDLERVEIIKGPQSALYGRNSFAGVINLVSRTPDLDEIEGFVRAGIGTDEFYEASGTINIPIIPGKVALLAHAAYQEFDGTIPNSHPLADAEGCITCGNLGGFERETYQVTLRAELSEALQFQASYFHTERFQEHVANVSFGTAGLDPYNYANCSPVGGQNRLYCGELPDTPNYATGAQSSPLPNVGAVPDPRPEGFLIDPRAFGLRGPTDVVSARVDFSPADPLTLTYQFGYTFGNVDGRGSTSRDPLQPVVFGPFNLGALFDSSGTGSEFESFSHDMRVTYESDRIYGFVGVNYSTTSDIESNVTENYPIGTLETPGEDAIFFPIGAGLPFPNIFLGRRTFLERDEDILSFYGFLEFSPTDSLSLTAEGRYTIEDRATIDRFTREPGNRAIQALNPPRDDITEEFFAPRFTASYELTPDNLLYASVAKGVKAGGSNGLGVPFPGQIQYRRETNWTYEIGSKNYFPEIGLTLNAALFYTDWNNLQTTEVRLDENGLIPQTFAVLSTVTGNVGSVTVKGAEVEGVLEVTDNITLDFGAAYNDATYDDGVTAQRFELAQTCDGTVCPNNGTVPIGGNQVERTPAFDAYAGLGYRGEFGEDNDYYLRVDASYQTKQYVDEVNLAWVPDRFLMNLQAGVNIGNISVSAVVQNLLDERYVSNSLFLIGTGGAGSTSYVPIFGLDRTARITVGYNF
jgi:iron complex outermembrane receptor protein